MVYQQLPEEGENSCHGYRHGIIFGIMAKMVHYKVGLQDIPPPYGVLQLKIIKILAYAYALFNICGGDIMLVLRQSYKQLIQLVHYA